MNTEIARILAIVRYELKMQQRSKALPGLTLGLLAVLGLVGLLTKDQIMSGSNGTGPYTLAQNLVAIVGSCLYLVLIIVLPPFVADVIAKDRQLAVSDLLASTPLSRWGYLLAKLVSAWVAVLAVVMLVLSAAGVWFWLLFGTYDLGISLQAVVILIVPLALLNPGLAVLLAATQSTRRGAIMVGVGVSFVSLFLMMLNLQTLDFWKDANAPVDWGNLLSLSRPALFRQINFSFVAGMSANNQIVSAYSYSYYNGAIGLTVLAGLLEISLVWLLIWQWLRFRDAK